MSAEDAQPATPSSSAPVLVGKDLVKKCELHLHKTACTTWDDNKGEYVYHNVCGTGTEALGKITGSVGVRLYFDFLKKMGFVFLLLFVLSGPMLAFNCMGSMAESTSALNKALAMTTVANIGHCPDTGCRSSQELQDRCLMEKNCGDEGLRVNEVTQWLGLLDGIGILVFMGFGAWYLHFTVPKVVQAHDVATLTPADYTVVVPICPRLLGEKSSETHHQYAEKLKEHFKTVLKNLKEEPISAEEAEDSIFDVVLVREYDGAISQFMYKGTLYKELANCEKLKEIYSADGDESKANKQDTYIAKYAKQLSDIDNSLKHQADQKDEDRLVCRAFVSFNKIAYKDKVLNEYRFAQFTLFRWCQSEEMQFEGNKIKVQQAVEPSDLYWENMDYTPYKKFLRKLAVNFVTFLVLLVCSIALVSIKSTTASVPISAYKTWVIQNADMEGNSCLDVCDLEMFSSVACSGPDNSDAWWVKKLFTQTDDLGSASYSGSSYWTGGSPSTCAGTNLSSSGCIAGQDWLAIEFNNPHSVRCIQAMQNHVRAASEFKFFGCASEVPSKDNRTGWTPETHCMPMQVQTALTDKLDVNHTGVHSGRMKVIQDTACAANISLSYAQEAKGRNDDWTLDCFCKAALVEDPGLMTGPYDTPEREVCKEWSFEQAKTYGLMVAGVLAVTVLNQVLLLIFAWLIDMEKTFSISEYTRSQFIKLFAAQFINTGLLIYLVNAKFGEIPSVMKVITEPLTILSIGKGNYWEANSAWFVAVGSSLVITILSQVISTTITPPIMANIVYPLLRRYALWSGQRVTLEAMYDIYQLPEWNMALRVAQSMNVICCVIFYSGGMPCLYFIGVLYCILAYWLDKWSLLKGSKRPPAYTEDIIEVCMNLTPLAAFLHTLFACSVLSNPELFPSKWSALRGLSEALFGINFEDYGVIRQEWEFATSDRKAELWNDYLQTRFLDFARTSCWLLLLIFLVGCTYYIIYYLYVLLLKPVLEPFAFALIQCVKKYCTCCNCREKKAGVETERKYSEAVEDMKKNGLAYTYNMQHNEKYKAAAKAIKKTAAEERDQESASGGGLFGWFSSAKKDEEKKEEEKKEEEPPNEEQAEAQEGQQQAQV